MQYKVIVGLVLLLIAFGILWLFITNWKSWVGGASDKEVCRLSVVAMAKTKTPIIGTASPFDLNCKTRTEIIKEKDKEKIKEALANSMYDCWYQMAEGKFDFFSDWDFGLSDSRCIICSINKFDENAWQGEMNVNEFEDYLNTKKIPIKKITYAEYFTGVENAKVDFGEEIMSLDKDNPVYTIFLVNKRSSWIKQLGLGAGAVGIAGGQVILFKAGKTAVGKVVGKVVGTRLIPFAGWALLAIDVVGIVAHKTDFYPTLILTSGTEVQNVCDALE